MKTPKRKFKDMKEMLLFVKALQVQTIASIKRLKADNKRYDKLLQEAEAALNEPQLKYKKK